MNAFELMETEFRAAKARGETTPADDVLMNALIELHDQVDAQSKTRALRKMKRRLGASLVGMDFTTACLAIVDVVDELHGRVEELEENFRKEKLLAEIRRREEKPNVQP